MLKGEKDANDVDIHVSSYNYEQKPKLYQLAVKNNLCDVVILPRDFVFGEILNHPTDNTFTTGFPIFPNTKRIPFSFSTASCAAATPSSESPTPTPKSQTLPSESPTASSEIPTLLSKFPTSPPGFPTASSKILTSLSDSALFPQLSRRLNPQTQPRRRRRILRLRFLFYQL